MYFRTIFLAETVLGRFVLGVKGFVFPVMCDFVLANFNIINCKQLIKKKSKVK